MLAIISQMSLFLLSLPINVRIFREIRQHLFKVTCSSFFFADAISLFKTRWQCLKNSQKCRFWILTFCIKIDLSVFDSKCKLKRSLFRSQCCMRLFMWFSNTVTILNIFCPMAKLIVFTWYLTSTFSPNAKITSNRWQLDFNPRRSIIFDFLICFSWIGVWHNANKGQ